MAKGDRGSVVGEAFAAAVLALMMVAAGCRVPDSSATAKIEGDRQTISVDTLESRFSPRVIEMEAGRPITVKVHNSALMSHTFTTNDPGVDVVVSPQETKEVTLTPKESTYFFCRFHEAQGMKGAMCARDKPCPLQRFP